MNRWTRRLSLLIAFAVLMLSTAPFAWAEDAAMGEAAETILMQVPANAQAEAAQARPVIDRTGNENEPGAAGGVDGDTLQSNEMTAGDEAATESAAPADAAPEPEQTASGGDQIIDLGGQASEAPKADGADGQASEAPRADGADGQASEASKADGADGQASEAPKADDADGQSGLGADQSNAPDEQAAYDEETLEESGQDAISDAEEDEEPAPTMPALRLAAAPIEPESIGVTVASGGIQAGSGIELWLDPDNRTAQLSATVLPEDADPSVIWHCDDESVATVSSGGVVTAQGAGTARVWASAGDGEVISEALTVTVCGAPQSIALSAHALDMDLGASQTLTASLPEGTASGLTWQSDNTAVVAVDDSGALTTVGAGTATVTVSAFNGVSDSCQVTVTAVPVSVELNILGCTLGVGETAHLTAVALDANGQPVETTYRLIRSNTSIANITADSPTSGDIRGVGVGTATITVVAHNDVSAVCTVRVMKAPTSLSLNVGGGTLGYDQARHIGMRYQLIPTLSPDGSSSKITWYGYDSSVVTVSEDGLVTAVGLGTTTITAKTYNGKTATCTAKIVAAPTSISLSESTLSLLTGKTHTLTVSVPSGTKADYTFESADEGVATVTADGLVTAVGAGTTVVTATAFNGVSASCQVTVPEPPASIELNILGCTLGVGETAHLSAVALDANGQPVETTFRLIRSDTGIANITADSLTSGDIRGVGVGTATITVVAHNDVSAVCTVRVMKAPTAIHLNTTGGTISYDEARHVGMSYQLVPTLSDGSASKVTWYGYDSNVVTVSEDGLVTATGLGSTTIVARTFNGKTASCHATVVPGPESVSLSDHALTLLTGQTHALTASVDASTRSTYSYSSSDESVVTVTDDGEVTAVGPGAATVTVSTYNGITDTCQVTVPSLPASIEMTATSCTLGAGESLALSPLALDEGGQPTQTSFTLSSDRSQTTTVSQDGVITGVAPGAATITATAHNGVTAECAVQVLEAPASLGISIGNGLLGYDTNQGVGMSRPVRVMLPTGSASAITYSGYDPNVLHVDEAGLVTATGLGETTITASAYNGVTAQCAVRVVPGPTQIAPDPAQMTLSAGQTAALRVNVAEGTAASFSYESSDAGVAGVSETGMVTAIAPGTAVVTVTAFNGVSATCPVTVLPAPAGVRLNAAECTLGVGEGFGLQAQVLDASGIETPADCRYASSNTAVASVSASGRITGRGVGTAKITVSAHNGVRAVCTVTVKKAPASIRLGIANGTLCYDAATGLGMTCTIRPILPAGTASAIRYSGYDERVVSVSADGVVTAVGLGQTRIAATTFNGVRAFCSLTVLPAPESIDLTPQSITVGVGQKQALKMGLPDGAIGSCTFESSDPSCAAVSSRGVLTALAPGEVTVTATAFNGVSDTCSVTVLPAPEDIALSGGLAIGVGERLTLDVSVLDDTGAATTAALSYVSDRPEIASVDAEGSILGRSIGTAKITVTAHNGVRAICIVTVKKAPGRLSILSGEQALSYDAAKGVGMQCALTAEMPASAASRISWSVDDPSVLTVDENGLVTAVGLGQATITARTYNGQSASLSMPVLPAPEAISVSPASRTLSVGERLTLAVSAGEGSASSYVYTSSKPKIAAVDENGVVTALQVGSAVITVRSFNGLTAKCNITVEPAPPAIYTDFDAITLGVDELSPPLNIRLEGGLSPEGLTVSVSDETVAVLNDDGRILALSVGSASFTLSSGGGASRVVTVTVLEAPTSLSLEPQSLELEVGDAASLSASIPDGQAGCIGFVSDRPSVASVDAGGHVTALKAGAATITAQTYNGVTATCQVRVVSPAVADRMPATLQLVVGYSATIDTQALTASGIPYQGTTTVEITPAGAATLNDGILTAHQLGSAVLTVTAGSYRQTCQISVVTYRQAHPLVAVAHRGGAAYWPENTLEAFRNAASTGADAVELDVHTAKDGVQVVNHNPTIVVNGVEYAIKDYTSAQLKSLKSDLCTLDEALEVISATDLYLVLELKEDGDGAACVAAVRRFGMQNRTTYISFTMERLNDVYAADQEAEMGYLISAINQQVDYVRLLTENMINLLMPTYTALSKSQVDNLHRAGLKVGVWTVNEAADINRMAQMDVDYITSDRPDLVAQAKQ